MQQDVRDIQVIKLKHFPISDFLMLETGITGAGAFEIAHEKDVQLFGRTERPPATEVWLELWRQTWHRLLSLKIWHLC